MKLNLRGSRVILAVVGLSTYLLGSTVIMLRYKGELKPVVLQLPERMEERRLEAQLSKAAMEKEAKKS